MDAGALDDLVGRCRVATGQGFKLDAFPTRATLPHGLDKAVAEELLAAGVRRLSDLQELLYAAASWSVLIIVQAIDAAGKDGTIKHVMSGVNPQGVAVTAFKAPSPEEQAHDFLWRVSRALPARGMIGVFNRSHYEEVLVARVHPDVLAAQRLPATLTASPRFWDDRIEDIAAFERHLAREGTLIVKFFLHVGADEQKKRLLARLEDPAKSWKFDPGDIAERHARPQILDAYQAAIAGTATEQAPWYIIPADQKWVMRLLVAHAICAAVGGLGLKPVKPTVEQQSRLKAAQARLLDEA